jgi:hypothetical protein
MVQKIIPQNAMNIPDSVGLFKLFYLFIGTHKQFLIFAHRTLASIGTHMLHELRSCALLFGGKISVPLCLYTVAAKGVQYSGSDQNSQVPRQATD